MISIHVTRKRAAQPALEPPADPAAARLLALLAHDGNGGLTIAGLLEHGIQAPAQAIYTLQLAGYQIERVPVGRANAGKTTGYRLRLPPSAATGAGGAEDDAL